MDIARFVTLFVLGSVWAAYCGTPTSKATGFAALSEGDELEVKLVSVDCIGNQSAYEFVFRKSTNGPGATVWGFKLERTVYGVTGDMTELISVLTNRVPIGSVTLTITNLIWLDETLAFYRLRLPRDFTGHTSVLFKQRQGGHLVAQEDFYDVADCVQYAFRQKLRPVLDLDWLRSRLEGKNEKSKR